MCGICGKLSLRGAERIDPLRIEEMSSAMRHRGPDDRGVYVSRKIGLGHRRLSIIDLHTGAQPLSNEDGTVWAVFNGEIYNYRTLREELLKRGHAFRTQTDTEVIVHLYEEYGEGFVSRLYGMFAIALWDEPRETVLLARDRVGIKPLYYYRTGDGIVFGSEIKALLADPAVPRRVNPAGISLLMSFSYIPGEETLLEGIKKVLPGHYLKIDGSGCVERAYWDLSFAKSREDVPLEEAAQTLDELLRSAVRDHMISDVPVGVLLSGGVDSTALLSYAAEETGQPLGAFTIGFEGEGFADERYYARLAARRFGTRHYDMTITAAEFRAFLPAYVRHMEEPVCEPPAVALYYVSRLAKDHVKVLLSGEGGDEAFAGYPEYRNFLWLEKIKRAAGPLRPLIGRALSLVTGAGPLSRFHRYGRFMALELKDYYYSRTASPLSFMNRYADDVYSPEFFGEFSGSAGREVLAAVRAPLLRAIGTLDLLDAMLYIDTKTWLSDDLLLKADKMTMANSIELRVPFLDHRVLEYAASLPAGLKLNGGTTKYILKRVFEGRVPDEILNRKKTGFPVPYRRWLSGDLQPYVNEVLRSRRARERGYFKRAAVERLLDANRREGSWAKELFLLLALELWHILFIDGELFTAPSGDGVAAAL